MSELSDIQDRAKDVDLVGQLLDRIATPDEAAAARRVLGVEAEANRLAEAYAPERAPVVFPGSQVDQMAVALDALDRYTAWRDSFPDGDPTPLAKRGRAVKLAELSVAALRAQQ